ncbi:MAG: DUF59 domain-containing protein [Puniceicoccaceae bacterium]|nr:MAG: DUF59 domain-containing protein [Puniceicoccaceae bacterium]
MNNETELIRDCDVTAIPSGVAHTLEKGSRVLVTQSLGGSVTVRTSEGLFRIDGADRDALAEPPEDFGPEEGAGGSGGDFGEEAVWAALRSCFDPEIPVNIVDLGLIYDLQIEPGGDGRHRVAVKMTLTAQGCGMGPVIARDAQTKIEALPEVESATVDIVWDPVWTPQMISPEGRKALGLE